MSLASSWQAGVQLRNYPGLFERKLEIASKLPASDCGVSPREPQLRVKGEQLPQYPGSLAWNRLGVDWPVACGLWLSCLLHGLGNSTSAAGSYLLAAGPGVGT